MSTKRTGTVPAPEARATGAEPGTPEEVSRFTIEAAVWAPSVHNTQPWWFSHRGREINVHADVERRLRLADADGREVVISCGAALFNIRLALRYLGYLPETTVLPDPDRPALMARVGWHERAPATEYERDLFDQIPRRRTHRGGFDPDPLPSALISVLRGNAARDGVMLRVMADDGRRAAMAAVVEAAEHVLRLNGARSEEIARWAPPPGSTRRDGVPPTAYPATPERTDPAFPGRDFANGHGWGLPPATSRPLLRSAGLVCMLTTATDTPADWLNCGQTLQRVLLAASVGGVSAALHSQPLELPHLREFIRIHLSEGAYPQMVLRLGTTGQVAQSIRRTADEVLL